MKKLLHSPLILSLIFIGLIVLLTVTGPEEKSLGSNVRIVYLHGAWVWTALGAFIAAGIIGLTALITHRDNLHGWSSALGRTGLLFWISYLPISLWAMQTNWNGLFLAEPRWRLAWVFAVSGLLLQLGLALIGKPAWTSAANFGFIMILLISISATAEVMHPSSPILQSNSPIIRIYFFLLLGATFLAAWLTAKGWLAFESKLSRDKSA